MPLTLVSPPTAEPVSLTEAKNHLRVTVADEDDLISLYIKTSRHHVEAYTRRSLIVQSHDWTLDGFENLLRLPRSPLRSVTHIKYLDGNGTEQTLATSVYTVDKASNPGRIALAYGQTWPATRDTLNAVTVRFKSGYAQPFTADAGTDTITATGHGYNNGDLVWLTNTGGALPAGLSADTPYYVVGATTDTLQMSLTSGGSARDITGAGTGTHFLGEVPTDIRHAILLMVGELYERREHAIAGVPISAVPFNVEALLGPHIIWVA